MDSLFVPNELTLPERKALVAHFEGLIDAREETRFFEFSLPGRPPLFVKYDIDILVEASTQTFFYHLSKGDESGPRVPKVFAAFVEDGYNFMVMEKIAAPTLSDSNISEEKAVECAAFAVKWLLDQLPSVPPSLFGTISSQPALLWHPFFKDHQPPRVFSGPDELIKYVSKASERCRPGARLSPSIQEELFRSFKETRCVYHSDISKDNFLFDSSNNTVWIIDFQHIGVLPQEFQTYAFFNIDKFAARVGRKLGYQPSNTANAMAPLAGLLMMCGMNASLGVQY